MRELKCEEESCILQVFSFPGNILRVTATLLDIWIKMMRMSQLIPVLLAHGKELNLNDPRCHTKEGKHLLAEGYRKEMESLVEDTKAWVPVSLERSRPLRSSVRRFFG